MRIAIDGNEANVSNRVGSNVYAYQLISAIEELTRSRSDIEVTVLLADSLQPDMPAARQNWQYQIVGPHPLWTQLALPWHLFTNTPRYDVLFTPGHYAPRLSVVPYVSSVMDLAFLEFPSQFKRRDYLQLKHWTAYSVRHAKRVVAISQATKKDVVKMYRRRAKEVVVAYPAATSQITKVPLVKSKAILKAMGIVGPYLLYVGTLQPRKNLERLVAAFEKLATRLDHEVGRSSQPQLQLVIAGKVGWLADSILARINESPYRSRIVLPGFVDDQAKAALYQTATASVLVGLYEGFGMPPLESMQYGAVPVVANTTSLPEVVGQAGILVNPLDVNDIAKGLYQATTLRASDRMRLQRLGRQQLRKFSWTASAAVVLQTLEEAADTAK